uniref:Uncharacterized protein n=1 Tax=Romanomermis culicivorax TaxID=13658 RepID=A0A915IXG6_ROMCU
MHGKDIKRDKLRVSIRLVYREFFYCQHKSGYQYVRNADKFGILIHSEYGEVLFLLYNTVRDTDAFGIPTDTHLRMSLEAQNDVHTSSKKPACTVSLSVHLTDAANKKGNQILANDLVIVLTMMGLATKDNHILIQDLIRLV